MTGNPAKALALSRPRKSGCGSQTKMQGPSSRLRCKSLRSSTSTTRWQVGKACPKLPQHLPIRLATGPHKAVLARVNEERQSDGWAGVDSDVQEPESGRSARLRNYLALALARNSR